MKSSWIAFAAAFSLVSNAALADRELIVPFEESGHVVLDQLSGLRVSSANGVAYAGPAGMSFRTEKADAFAPGASGDETHLTSMWFSPSADVFVTDHLSIGGLVEIAHSWGYEMSAGQRLELPGTTSMTFLPRVGFFAPIGDRFGFWPRVAFGWTSSQSVSFDASGTVPTVDTFRSMLLDVDLTVVYRLNETFFLRFGPEVGVTLGGTHSEDVNGASAAADASVVQISGVAGFGMNLEL